MNLMTSFLLADTAEETFHFSISLFEKYVAANSLDTAFGELNRNAYKSMFYSAFFQNISATALQEFCGERFCSLGTITVSDSLSKTISENYYQLARGSCSSSVFTETNW